MRHLLTVGEAEPRQGPLGVPLHPEAVGQAVTDLEACLGVALRGGGLIPSEGFRAILLHHDALGVAVG